MKKFLEIITCLCAGVIAASAESIVFDGNENLNSCIKFEALD